MNLATDWSSSSDCRRHRGRMEWLPTDRGVSAHLSETWVGMGGEGKMWNHRPRVLVPPAARALACGQSPRLAADGGTTSATALPLLDQGSP